MRTRRALRSDVCREGRARPRGVPRHRGVRTEFQYKRRAVLAGRSAAIGEARPPSAGRLSQPRRLLQALVARRALAGVFLSAATSRARPRRRSAGPSTSCRTPASQQGAAPLWIATDQEGGAVSRLSPPLTRMPPIAEDRGAASRPCGALARDPPLCGAAGARPCGARRQPQLRPGGRPEPWRAQSGGPPVAHRDARDSTDPIVVTDVAGRVLRDTQAHRRALHAEAFSRPRPRLRGHPQGHRRTRSRVRAS